MNLENKNPIILMLSGKAGSGKNTASNIISDICMEKNLKVVSIAFASYLKEYAKKILNWDGNEETKPREFLQQLGIELIKEQIDKEFLIKRIIDDIKIYSYYFDVIIITDARLKDEIENIKKSFNKVASIHIIGLNNNLTKKEQNHKTEIDLDEYHNYDFEIINNSSIDDLKIELKDLLKGVL